MVAEKYPLKGKKERKETLTRYRSFKKKMKRCIDLDTSMFFKSAEIQMKCIN